MQEFFCMLANIQTLHSCPTNFIFIFDVQILNFKQQFALFLNHSFTFQMTSAILRFVC